MKKIGFTLPVEKQADITDETAFKTAVAVEEPPEKKPLTAKQKKALEKQKAEVISEAVGQSKVPEEISEVDNQ